MVPRQPSFGSLQSERPDDDDTTSGWDVITGGSGVIARPGSTDQVYIKTHVYTKIDVYLS